MSEREAARGLGAERRDAPVEREHGQVEGHASEVLVAHFRSGPLPPAREAAEFESILPGAFDRILSMAEHQAEHRRMQETQIVDAAIRVEPRGQWLAFVIALTGFVCGTLLVVMDKSLGGLAAMFTGLAVLVGVFVQQKRRRVQDAEQQLDPRAIGPGRLDTSVPMGRQNGRST